MPRPFTNAARYLPLDELLDMPAIRVLRLLRHFESATQRDLLDAGREDNDAARQAFGRALVKHKRNGFVTRTGSIPYRYAITDAGLSYLRAVLAKGEVGEPIAGRVSP
jgi:hypothetical protein